MSYKKEREREREREKEREVNMGVTCNNLRIAEYK
jgi:hypothetical protein